MAEIPRSFGWPIHLDLVPLLPLRPPSRLRACGREIKSAFERANRRQPEGHSFENRYNLSSPTGAGDACAPRQWSSPWRTAQGRSPCRRQKNRHTAQRRPQRLICLQSFAAWKIVCRLTAIRCTPG